MVQTEDEYWQEAYNATASLASQVFMLSATQGGTEAPIPSHPLLYAPMPPVDQENSGVDDADSVSPMDTGVTGQNENLRDVTEAVSRAQRATAYLNFLEELGNNYMEDLYYSDMNDVIPGADHNYVGPHPPEVTSHSPSSEESGVAGPPGPLHSYLLAHFRRMLLPVQRSTRTTASNATNLGQRSHSMPNIHHAGSSSDPEGFAAHAAPLEMPALHHDFDSLFSTLFAHFYYECFLWIYLNVLLSEHCQDTRNRLKFLGIISGQSLENVTLNILLGYFNGYQQGREALLREVRGVLDRVSLSGEHGLTATRASWLRELSIEVGLHLNPRQMLSSFSTVVTDVVFTRAVARMGPRG